jgi:hypothetical protein
MEDREWMYTGHPSMEGMSSEWMLKTNEFLELTFVGEPAPGGIWCPCTECDNQVQNDKITMSEHLGKHGFTQGCYQWVFHGEPE